MPCPSHPLWLHHSYYTWYRVQSWSFSLCSAFQPPDTTSLFGTNILLSILFSNTLSLCPFLHVRHQVSHPYGTMSKIAVFRQQTRRKKVLDGMVSTTRIKSPLNFLLNQILIVTVIPKYLNCNTFSNDLFAIFMSRIWPAFWWQDSNIYLVLSAFSL
jgi:hypothetical protein